ncbi:MAG: DNA polymerase III subunit delta [Lachnospiraceae bacterium]|nr:DNA polymerase III subunit delta [Lachnospiraceae bacterium]
MQRIIADIKTGELKQAYLLYGPEDYLRKQYRDKLKEALSGGAGQMMDASMNCHRFSGKDVNQGEIIDLAETMPFLAERRILILEDTGLFKKGGEQLADYLKAPAETAFFLFVEKEVDKRNRLFKAVQGQGLTVEFQVQDEKTLKRWILAILKKENLQIAENAMDLLLDMTGADMENIRSELEKLICYCMGKTSVNKEDVESVCTKQVSGQMFAMIDAIVAKRQQEAMRLYYDLLTLKEPPMRILSLIVRQFNLLLQVKEMKSLGNDNFSMAKKLALPEFVVRKYIALSTKMKKSYLRQALADCLMADERVKTGKMNDQLSVELLIIKYSSIVEEK